jgi:hypothetical protein
MGVQDINRALTKVGSPWRLVSYDQVTAEFRKEGEVGTVALPIDVLLHATSATKELDAALAKR